MQQCETSEPQVKRYLPLKREVTPKINHTKTTIAKSAPFLITKHHLDDTQMKRALHYDDETNRNHTRRYSYKGEVVSCQNSKISTKIHPNTSTFNHKPKPKNGENHNNDYYAKDSQEESRTKIPVREQFQQNHEMPYFTNSGVRQARSNTNTINHDQNYKSYEERLAKKTHQLAKEYQQYGLHQMQAVRLTIEKQAKRLRKLHQKQVQKDISEIQHNKKLSKLQNELRNLRIRNLQLEKQKYLGQLSSHIKEEQTIKQKKTVQSFQNVKINRAKLILNKPRYKSSNFNAEDTDSSFSSFELT